MYTFWAVPCTDNQRTPIGGPKYNLRYLRLLFPWSSSSVLPLGCPIPIMLSYHLLLPVHPFVVRVALIKLGFKWPSAALLSLQTSLYPPICVPFFCFWLFNCPMKSSSRSYLSGPNCVVATDSSRKVSSSLTLPVFETQERK